MELNKDLAYFIGVLHSDGCIHHFKDKRKNLVSIRICLGIGKKSLPMAEKFQNILLNCFNRRVNIRKTKRNGYVIQTSINRIYSIIQNWERYKLPEELKSNSSLFGSYLAGLIDGDGNVKLKNNKDRKLKQLVISIADQNKRVELKDMIKRFMNCGAHIYRYKKAKCYDTCFYVTYKNLAFLENFVFPNITIPHKIIKLREYSKILSGSTGSRNSVL